MKIAPHRILSCFQISSTRLLALQCSKKLNQPHNSDSVYTIIIFPSSASTSWTFFWRGQGQNTAQNSSKHAILKWKNIFYGEGPSPRPPHVPPIVLRQAFWTPPLRFLRSLPRATPLLLKYTQACSFSEKNYTNEADFSLTMQILSVLTLLQARKK